MRHCEKLLLVAILLLAGIMRFVNVTTSPGYEWDEPVYAIVAQQTTIVGYPNLKGEGNTYNTNVYLYHPPFDFYLKGAWFKLLGTSNVADIGAGRILSAIEGMIALILAFFCLKEVAGKKAAFIGLIFLATDGWLIYTNRLNLIENGMMPLGILGIWLYIKATKTQKTLYYTLAGMFLAFAAIYKHTGIPFLLVPLVNPLMSRRNWKNHLVIFLTIAVVLLLYVDAMLILWPKDFLFDNWVQIQRALGIISSHGLNYGLGEVISAIIQTYWVFFITVVSIIGIGVLVGYRLLQVVFQGRQMPNSVLLSWALVAFAFLAAIALKGPQYLITVLVPAYMFIASELGGWLNGTGNNKSQSNEKLKTKKGYMIILLGLVALANMFTWNVRFIQHKDNALAETFNYFETVPVTARVIVDQCIGPMLTQPYFDSNYHPGEQGNYIVLYSSLTQKPPVNPSLDRLVLKSHLVKHIVGFKETVNIYQVK
jgi:4-amino-4-deoxy-L-arabinose transferase-like glycosyltransferase